MGMKIIAIRIGERYGPEYEKYLEEKLPEYDFVWIRKPIRDDVLLQWNKMYAMSLDIDEPVVVMDIDVFEHNEAFASASCAIANEIGIPDDRFNLNGGAVSLGHPLGSSGTRCLITMLGILRRIDGHKGIVSLCLGGGNAVAMLIERIE